MEELPVVQDGPAPVERADAARNRESILLAAERLFGEHGAACVSMDDIAAEAGVGKGTLFRRFGDRAGLAQAMLTERERRFQEAVIRGPAPLGPGAPPLDRLIAFGHAALHHYTDIGDLVVAAEARGARYRSAPYAFNLAHVSILVREAVPDADWEYISDVLMGALAAAHLKYLREDRGMTVERLCIGWEDLVARLLRCR